jgi:uncharacterized protein YjbI with pentapeptide repeats
MTAKELLERYATGERDFTRVKISGSEEMLEGACLRGINLSDSRIDNLSFIGANLSSAVFRNTILWQTDFSKADLNGANLSGADLFQANFSGANLSEADLSGSDLSETCFEKANLGRTILRNAIDRDTNFMRTIFIDTIMPDGSINNSTI